MYRGESDFAVLRAMERSWLPTLSARDQKAGPLPTSLRAGFRLPFPALRIAQDDRLGHGVRADWWGREEQKQILHSAEERFFQDDKSFGSGGPSSDEMLLSGWQMLES